MMAVLAGVELRLALITTMTPTNANMSLSGIYPNMHDALKLQDRFAVGTRCGCSKLSLTKTCNQASPDARKNHEELTNVICCSS
jgi:hypothetical protein